jgi:hypothetical protein
MSVEYTVKVDYGPRSRPLTGSAVPPGGSQEHQRLDEDQAKAALEAFLTDLWRFHGNGVQSITITANRGGGE